MDLLKKELEKKRLALESAKAARAAEAAATSSVAVDNGATGKRYIKASELRRVQEQVEEEIRTNGTAKSSRKRERQGDEFDHVSAASMEQAKPTEHEMKESKTSTELRLDPKNDQKENYTTQEITVKLRELGLPIRLFGEADSDRTRLERLRTALALQHQQLASMTEQNEFRLAHGHGIRNPFLERDEETAGVKKEEKRRKEEVTAEDDEDISNDPNKRIYRYFKGLLTQWEDDLVSRPEGEKRSVAGRNETNTYKQCKDYIRPLFKMCKKRQLEDNIVAHLMKIVEFCEEQEFVKANDAYMDVAIGRAAWPIGVTMVGIHARSGREKIASGNVAHVMNSELQRKYLTSVKRLMTFAQKKSNVDPSKKVTM